MVEETEDNNGDTRDVYDRLSETQRQGIERERERDRERRADVVPIREKPERIKPEDDEEPEVA